MATEDFNPFDFSNEYPIEAPVAVDPQQFLPPREEAKEAKAAPRGHNHTNLRMAYEYFLDKGLAPHQAAAIAGNIAQESGGHTRAEGGGKIANDPYSLGFAQWNRDRLQGLQNYAAAQGAHAIDPRIQLDYMWHELNTSERPALKALLAANNLEDATHAFGAGYERPNEKYANYAGRINYARNVLQNAQANEAMGGGHPDVGPMRVVPVYDHDAKRAGQLAIPEGTSAEDAIAAIQQHGRRVEELITHPLVGNRALTLPASANVNDALKKLQAQHPDQDWMTQEHAEKTGLGAGMASTFKSIPSLLQRGAGEIAEEFEPTREMGQEWIKSAKARQEELGKMYEAPLETDPMRTKLGYYGGAALGGLPLAAGAFVPGAFGAAALGLPTALSAIGGTAQRFDEEGKPYSLADPATFAAAAGETGLQMVGMRGLNPAAGKFVESALKGAGGAALADIPSVALERLAAGQPLTSKEALEEYGGTAIGDVFGGGVLGGAAGKLKQVRAEEATQRPPGIPPPEGELTPELAPTHGEDQTIEDIAEEIRRQEPLPPMPERAAPPRLMAPEELPPEVAPPVEPMPEGPAPEMPPEMAPPEMAPPEAEIPEPVLRTPPERHELAEILDLKPSNDKRSLYQKLGQLDIRNRPEDLDKLDAYMNTTKMSFTPDQWQALEAHIDEVRNAHEIKKTAEPDAGSGPQPEVRQEGEGAPEGGEGIREGGPEGGPTETVPPQEVKHPGEALRQQWIDYFQNKHDDYVQRNPEKASGPVPAHFRNGIDQLRALPPEKFFNEDGTPAPIEGVLRRDEQGGFAPVTPPEKAEVPEPPKAPEAPEPVKAPEKPEAPEIAEGEQGRKEFAERVGAEYKGPGERISARLRTPRNAVLGEHVKAGNIEGALDELSKSANPFHQKVAEHARRLKDVVLQPNNRLKALAGRHRVWFAPRPGQPKHIVDLHPAHVDDVDTVAHEFLHGLTVEAIHAPTAEQAPHVNALKNLYGKVKNHPHMLSHPSKGPQLGKMYGVKNIYEFIAEGFSNPEFQHRLHQIELTKNVTAWDRFTQLIGKLIGVKKDTALTELTTHANRLLETVYKAESEKPATHGRGTEEPLVHGREDDVGYHAGDLGYGHDTTLGRMSGGRGTGHFGTGVYFVGDKSRIGSRADRPVYEIDFSDYNLARPDNEADAQDLHNGLRDINRLVDHVKDGVLQPSEKVNDLLRSAAYNLKFSVYPKKNGRHVTQDEIKASIIKNVQERAPVSDKVFATSAYEDTAATRVMKDLGFEGVDVRHIPKFDSGDYGSVIYKKSLASEAAAKERPEVLTHGREDDDLADRAIREADETHRGSWFDRMQDKLSDAYTKFQTEVVSHKAPLERILGGQSMFRGADGEIRTKAKMAQSTHVGEITNESYKHGYIKRNALGMNEVVHDPRLSLEKWREDFSALPDDLREKFAEAINTLSMHGHNTRHAEHMDLFRVNQDHIDDAKALRDAVTRELKAMRASHEGSAKEFAQLLDVMDAANKDIVKREKLMTALKAKYKHVREIGEGKIFDVSDADAAEARRVLNSSPETRDLAERLRKSLQKDAELLRDNNVISEKTFEKFTDPKYDYAPRYMQMEELEEIFPDVGLYPGAGGQRRVGSPKRLKGGQHEVNILENLFRHRAKMAANAIHNNARLGALEDLARLDMAKKLPPNSTPTAKIQAVAALEKGKRVYYQVDDKSLYDAFSILHHMPFNGPITQYVTSATKTASRLMLVNPGYWFNQLMREPFMAATSTGMSFRHSLSLPFDTAATFASLLLDKSGNNHVLYNQLKAAGVTASHDYIRGRIKDELKDVIKPPANKIEASKKWLADTSKVAMRVHEYADAATKVATMKRLIQEAKSGRMTGERMNDEQARAAAISKVGEMLNLQARGRDTLVNYFNNTTPFFNTYIQGIDAIIRNATGHGMTEHEAKMARQTMRAHVLALTAFSTASAVALSLYSEAYRNAKPDDLLNNWVLPVGDGAHLLKAKAPFEFTVFKAIPEMIVRNALGLDTGESNWDHTSAQFWRNLAPPGFESLGIPFIMKPLAEAAFNSTVDWVKGDFHPIASGDIAPAERGKGQTVFGDVISKMAGGHVSPAAVNHIVGGYAPELAQAINSTANLTSALIGTAFGRKDGKDITRDITETVPFLHDIMTNPNKMDASVRDFAQEQKMLKSTARYMQRRGMEGSEKYFKEGKYSIPAGRLDDVVSAYDTQIARIRNMGPFKDAQEAEKYAQKYQRLQEQKRAALAREKKFREKVEAKD